MMKCRRKSLRRHERAWLQDAPVIFSGLSHERVLSWLELYRVLHSMLGNQRTKMALHAHAVDLCSCFCCYPRHTTFPGWNEGSKATIPHGRPQYEQWRSARFDRTFVRQLSGVYLVANIRGVYVWDRNLIMENIPYTHQVFTRGGWDDFDFAIVV